MTKSTKTKKDLRQPSLAKFLRPVAAMPAGSPLSATEGSTLHMRLAACRKKTGYAKWSAADKAAIVEKCRASGVAVAVRQWNRDAGGSALTSGTASRWLKEAKDVEPGATPKPVKRGRPRILEDEEEDKVMQHLVALRDEGEEVSALIAGATAHAVARTAGKGDEFKDVDRAREWGKKFMVRRGWVKRRKTTSKVVITTELQAAKDSMLESIEAEVYTWGIPPQLVVNTDHTSVPLLPSNGFTYHPKGAKVVPLKRTDDKRAITGVLGCNALGERLKLQLIYAGKTLRVVPALPKNVIGVATPHHWANESTTLTYIQHALIPFLTHQKKKLGLPESQRSLVIWDRFTGQMTPDVKEKLEQNNISLAIIPAGWTGQLQPLDVAVMAPFKARIRHSFASWFSKKLKRRMKKFDKKATSSATRPHFTNMVPTKTKDIRPVHVEWVINAYNKLTPGTFCIGFKKSGILDAMAPLPPGSSYPTQPSEGDEYDEVEFALGKDYGSLILSGDGEEADEHTDEQKEIPTAPRQTFVYPEQPCEVRGCHRLAEFGCACHKLTCAVHNQLQCPEHVSRIRCPLCRTPIRLYDCVANSASVYSCGPCLAASSPVNQISGPVIDVDSLSEDEEDTVFKELTQLAELVGDIMDLEC